MDLPEHLQVLALVLGAVLIGLLAGFLVPTVTLGGVTMQTSLVLGVAGSLLVIAMGIQEYRTGETRARVMIGLYVLGFLLSLADYTPVVLLGILILLVSLGVGTELDHWIRERVNG